jgi:hypothetical protein
MSHGRNGRTAMRFSGVTFDFGIIRKLPFGVDVMLDQDFNVLKQTLGWRKKLWEPPFVIICCQLYWSPENGRRSRFEGSFYILYPLLCINISTFNALHSA